MVNPQVNRRNQIIYISVAILFFAVLGLILVHRRSFVDFPVYYLAGRSLINGRSDLYSPEFSGGPLMDYRYPPFFISVFAWLALFPPVWASYVWYWLCLIQMAGCVLILRSASKMQLVAYRTGYSEWKVWLISSLAVGVYFVIALKGGNAHVLMTFLLFCSFWFVLQHRDRAGGVLLSLAITIKIVPLLAIPYFVLKKRWKLLISTGAFLVIFNLAPAMYLGFQKNGELLRTWWQHVVLNQEVHERNAVINLSLKGQLTRYLTDVDYRQRGAGTESTDTAYRAVNVLSLSPDHVHRIWLLLAFSLYASTLILIWLVARRTNREEITLLELGLVVCLMLLVEPLAAKQYFIELLWPIVALAIFVFDRDQLVSKICKYLLFFVAAINVISPLLPGRSVQRLILVLGIDFYVTCFVFVGLVLALLLSAKGQDIVSSPRSQGLPAAQSHI